MNTPNPIHPPAPFSCTYSPNLPELISKLNCTLAISTYQAGKVIFISAVDDNQLIQLPRNFKKAMGMAVKDHQLAVATKDEVVILGNAPGLAPNYPPQPNTYDGLYVPRAKYYTGEVDLHDMEWGEKGLYAVNTRFSCISLINNKYSFEPVWQPHFITDLDPIDRCHLNGMVMQNGQPKYVTALGVSNQEKGWRPSVETGGVLMDVESNEFILKGLAMPHSPRIFDGEVYALLSATGELIKVDVSKGTYEVIAAFDGFLRGMDKIGDYLFIGLSKLRQNSSTFRDLPIAKKALSSGIQVLHLPTGAVVANLTYQASVEELYDVKMLNGFRRPGVLGVDRDEHRRALVTPTDNYWSEPSEDQ
ncbi:TIGR03032 family protein [Reichenbachiella versicolor]|uniref:TIGR03032 family protein n=1 Tax=Reichenbachiella versicolor TaxID=1821036 RepID=UPI001FEB822C|nr:TIGR03032 family protein [Reichenbachiella versicolor]